MLAEQRFRRLDAPEKMKLVYPGIDLQESLEVKQEEVLAVASTIYTPIGKTSLDFTLL